MKSQEMEEMEMMDRQFQSQMGMGMNQMERMVNPWGDGGFPPRRGMGRGQGRGTARVDSDYLAYREEPGLTGGFGRGGWSGQSRGGRGGSTRGSVKDRLGQTAGDLTINHMFDDLYEQPQSTPKSVSAFEKARSKLGSRNPGNYQGPQLGGPPNKTWSN